MLVKLMISTRSSRSNISKIISIKRKKKRKCIQRKKRKCIQRKRGSKQSFVDDVKKGEKLKNQKQIDERIKSKLMKESKVD